MLASGCDWLSVTVPTGVAESLLSRSVEGFGGHPARGRGFREAERRGVLGGLVTRRRDPVSPSRLWGLSYESWEFEGGAAGSGLLDVLSGQGRASRIDWAMDYAVPNELSAQLLADEWLIEGAKARGFKPYPRGGADGPEEHVTWYVGSSASDRMTRIYRKDWQNRSLYGDEMVLRIEVQVMGDHAEAMLDALRAFSDPDDVRRHGRRIAAAHLEQLCGLVIDAEGYVPDTPKREHAAIEDSLFHLLEQHGSRIDALVRAGVPLLDLARTRAVTASRMTKYRAEKVVEQVERCGLDELVSAMRFRIGEGASGASV